MPLAFNLHPSTFILTMTHPGYKQTEVGVIPEEWEVKQIQDVCRLINGRGFKPHEWQTRGLPIIRIQNLNGSEDFNFYSGQYDPKILVEHGQLLFAWSGSRSTSFGPHVWNGGRALLNYHTWKVAVQENKADPDFLLHALRQLTSYIEDRAHGASALVHTQKWEMEKFPIPMPRHLPEQRAIATALSDVDALLAALDRLIAKQRDLKQAAMQQLLTGQTRLPGFTGKWETKRLGEIAKIQRGASPRPIDSPIWFDENSPIGWVRISDVTRSGMFLQETTQRLSPLGVAHSRPVPTGSLIMSICATVGRPVITKIDVCIHDGFVVFDNPQADQLFLYYVLKWIEPDWSKHGQTGSQMNLNTGLITGTPILLPPLPEQTAIATVLSDMDLELAALEQRRDKTRALKQGMMQELLTGRTRLV
jgi:type I restriction enzyme S subunit